MAECEVVFHRVLGVEFPKLGGDLLSGGPTRCAAARQAEVPADAVNVRVDRYHEVRRRDGPKPQVDAICRTDHPARVQDQPFASAAGSRITDEVSGASIASVSTNRIRETGEALPEVAISLMERTECGSKGTVLSKEVPRSEKQAGEVLLAIDPVDESV